jgi:hypothetical protein
MVSRMMTTPPVITTTAARILQDLALFIIGPPRFLGIVVHANIDSLSGGEDNHQRVFKTERLGQGSRAFLW